MLQAFVLGMATSLASAPPSQGAACILAQARPADAEITASMVLLQPSSLSKDQGELVVRMKRVIQECNKSLRLPDAISATEDDEAFKTLAAIGFRNRLSTRGIDPTWVDDWFEAQSEDVQMKLGCGDDSTSLKGPEIDSMRAALEGRGLSRDLVISQDKLLDAYLVMRVMVNRNRHGLPVDRC